MPDWQELVRKQLAGIQLPEDETAQVVEELSNHLEEMYQSLIRARVPEQAAVRRALQEVNNWQQLRSRIESARKEESDVNKRVTQFWLPALITLFSAMVLLPLFQAFSPSRRLSATPGGLIGWTPVTTVYVSWLACLLLVGAAGGFISRRAGGPARLAFASILFPVLPYLAFFLIGLPVHMLLDDRVAHNLIIPAFFIGLFAWVILPGGALVCGGLPAHYLASPRDS